MLRAFLIPTELLFGIVILLVVGELACGTSIYFVTMASISTLCGLIVYNLLGGLSTFSGIIFTNLFVRSLALCQVVKILSLEPADRNLDNPTLTITVYAGFYFFLMLGVMLFGKLRMVLPRPLAVTTEEQSMSLYLLTLVVGMTATIVFQMLWGFDASGNSSEGGLAHQFGVAFSGLLLLSLVVAVERRIRLSGGRHSFGILALLPWSFLSVFSLVSNARRDMLMPSIVYVVVCYFRGYRLKLQHFALGAAGLAVFYLVLGPFVVFSRFMLQELPFKDRVTMAFRLLRDHHDPRELAGALATSASGAGNVREVYFDDQRLLMLNRFALIRADSNLIAATANGNHYGFETIRQDLIAASPSILNPNKNATSLSSGDYRGRVSGVSGDVSGLTFPVATPTAECYAAFGWGGVVVIPLLVIPLTFIIFESVYHLDNTWAIIALGMTAAQFPEVGVSGLVFTAVRTPLLILFLSYLVGGAARYIAILHRERDPAGRIPEAALQPAHEEH